MANRQAEAARASRPAVENAFRKICPNFAGRTWLAAGNRYAIDTVGRLKTDSSASPPALQEDDLAQYIAASAPLHLLDGWSFLGRAVDAALRGDPDAARHLAYYAELRAAMAPLASEGLGVFSDRHFVLESSSRPVKIPNGTTHTVVWELLEAWCREPKAAALVGGIVGVGGISLSAWLGHFQVAAGGSAALAPVAADWLTMWGLDLHRFSDDRDARNNSSYRPTGIVQASRLRTSDCLAAVADVWSALEPAGVGSFDIIDRYLLRLCVESVFKAVVGGVSTPADKLRFRQEVSGMIQRAAPSSDERRLRDFLLRRRDRSEPALLRLAQASDPPTAADHHLQVLSRAALLLRIANGACALLVQGGGASLRQLRFWWTGLGEARGCWERGSIPADLTDLWADVKQALDEVRLRRAKLGKRASLATWRQGSAVEIAVLGECERIGFWGLNV